MAFDNAYPGHKRLDLLPGDHPNTAILQTSGIGGVTWSAAFDWMDTYVAGRDQGSARLPAVRVAPRGPDEGDILESGLFEKYPFEPYPSLAAATGAAQRQYLATSTGLLPARTLSATPGAGTTSLREAENLLLQNGIPMYEGVFELFTGVPPTVPLDLVDPGVTGVFTGKPLTSELKLRGAATAHLVLTPSATHGSVFVYLLERAPAAAAPTSSPTSPTAGPEPPPAPR